MIIKNMNIKHILFTTLVIPTICLVFLVFFNTTAYADDYTLSTYDLYNSNMTISLPDGWYFNTQKEIDKDFLNITENSVARLKKYFLQQHVEYNLVSKDLKSEINVIVLHNTKTKLVYDFNTLEDEKLWSQVKSIAATGNENEKNNISASYEEYDIKKIGKCIYAYIVGEMTEESQNSIISQYSTIINGYGINVSIKSYDKSRYEEDAELISEIVDSIEIHEVYESNRKKQMILEFAPPAILILGFLGFTIYLFIVQIKKNKKEKGEQ